MLAQHLGSGTRPTAHSSAHGPSIFIIHCAGSTARELYTAYSTPLGSRPLVFIIHRVGSTYREWYTAYSTPHLLTAPHFFIIHGAGSTAREWYTAYSTPLCSRPLVFIIHRDSSKYREWYTAYSTPHLLMAPRFYNLPCWLRFSGVADGLQHTHLLAAPRFYNPPCHEQPQARLNHRKIRRIRALHHGTPWSHPPTVRSDESEHCL